MANKLKDTTPRPRIGKTAKDTRVARLIDINKAIDALPAAPTTKIVNISSAQILAMGTTPIELLPAPGVGKYYDWELIIESTTSDYTMTYDLLIRCDPYENVLANLDPYLIKDGTDQVTLVKGTNTWYGGDSKFAPTPMNHSLVLTAISSPTGGVGTLRAIITYTVRTFGA